jgi:phage head maturation protease
MTSIRRGDVSQMSFGFMVPTGGSEFATEAGTIVRTLRTVKLYDVSPVTFPAYPQTTVQVRSLVDGLRAQSDSSQPGEARARLALRRRTLQLTEVEM